MTANKILLRISIINYLRKLGKLVSIVKDNLVKVKIYYKIKVSWKLIRMRYNNQFQIYKINLINPILLIFKI